MGYPPDAASATVLMLMGYVPDDREQGAAMNDVSTYMLDTNVFNGLLRGDFSHSIFEKRRLIVTGIQRDELSKTPDQAKRARLLERFDSVAPDIVLAASFAFDIEGAGFDQATWNDGAGTAQRMHLRLLGLDRKKGKRRNSLNQWRDVLIAETAIKAGAVLVTGDINLRLVMTEFGGKAIDPTVLQKPILI